MFGSPSQTTWDEVETLLWGKGTRYIRGTNRHMSSLIGIQPDWGLIGVPITLDKLYDFGPRFPYLQNGYKNVRL